MKQERGYRFAMPAKFVQQSSGLRVPQEDKTVASACKQQQANSHKARRRARVGQEFPRHDYSARFEDKERVMLGANVDALHCNIAREHESTD